MSYCKNFFLGKKILVTGTTGMLGKDFYSHYKEEGAQVFTLNRADGDLLDFEFVKRFVESLEPEIIIHCIASTNLKRCEEKQEETMLLHCGLTHCLSSFKSKFVYISSDAVVNPTNFYAKTKLLGEEISLLNNEESLVVRTNIYGFDSSSGGSLFEWAYKNLKQGNEIGGYTNVFFNALYTKQLVEAVTVLLENNHKGRVNIAGNYSISKYHFLKKICEVFNLDFNNLKEVQIDNSGLVKRNCDTTLNVTEINKLYGIEYNLTNGLLQMKTDLENYEEHKH